MIHVDKIVAADYIATISDGRPLLIGLFELLEVPRDITNDTLPLLGMGFLAWAWSDEPVSQDFLQWTVGVDDQKELFTAPATIISAVQGSPKLFIVSTPIVVSVQPLVEANSLWVALTHAHEGLLKREIIAIRKI